MAARLSRQPDDPTDQVYWSAQQQEEASVQSQLTLTQRPETAAKSIVTSATGHHQVMPFRVNSGAHSAANQKAEDIPELNRFSDTVPQDPLPDTSSLEVPTRNFKKMPDNSSHSVSNKSPRSGQKPVRADDQNAADVQFD